MSQGFNFIGIKLGTDLANIFSSPSSIAMVMGHEREHPNQGFYGNEYNAKHQSVHSAGVRHIRESGLAGGDLVNIGRYRND